MSTEVEFFGEVRGGLSRITLTFWIYNHFLSVVLVAVLTGSGLGGFLLVVFSRILFILTNIDVATF